MIAGQLGVIVWLEKRSEQSKLIHVLEVRVRSLKFSLKRLVYFNK